LDGIGLNWQVGGWFEDKMKVLFVYRYYGLKLSNTVIDFQLNSLLSQDLVIHNFYIEKGGIKNYIKSIFKLRRFLKNNEFDLVHAHYSFSGFIAALAFKKPVICSLMGSDIFQLGKLHLFITRFFSIFLWKATIVKTKQMHSKIHPSLIIPNGLNLTNFRQILKQESFNQVGFSEHKKHILFVAQDPDSKVKNMKLASQAIQQVGEVDIELQIISGKSFEELPYYYCAADLLILTSLSEGSPNVIKEAMACNCPIVSTDVGDVKEIIGNTDGCYICTSDPKDVAEKIELALEFARTKGRTNGRQRIIELGLDSETIARRIVEVYKSVKK